MASFGSVASDPVAAAPAALGRPWKYFGCVNVWPSSFEPTRSPFTFRIEPFAWSENTPWAMPVTTSGYAIPVITVKTINITMAGSSWRRITSPPAR